MNTINKDKIVLKRTLLVIWFSFSCLLGFLLISGINIKYNMALLFLHFCIFLPLLLMLNREKNFYLFEPIYLFAFFFAFQFLFTTIPIYSQEHINWNSSVYFNPLNPGNIDVLYAISFGILSFYLGYFYIKFLYRKNIYQQHDININNAGKYVKIFIVLYVISITFRVYGYSIGALGSLAALQGTSISLPFVSIWYFIANLWPIYFGYFSLLSFSNNRKIKSFFVLILCLEIIFMLISGDRRNMLIFFVVYFFCFYLIKHTLPWKKIFTGFILTLLVIFPIITIYGYGLNNVGTVNFDEFYTLLANSTSLFSSLSLTDIWNGFILDPIKELNQFVPLGISYTEYAAKDINWGLVGFENLLSNIFPSFMSDRAFDARNYYQLFADQAMYRKVEYSPLTFTFQQEMILGFGLPALVIGMFVQGIAINFIFHKFNNINSPILFRIVYIGLFYRFSYGFNSGLLTSDMITPIRVLVYVSVIYLFYKFVFYRKNNPV